ncbi:hypothetical protein OSB04_002954 [Centaurea solstitialis]|uniref:Uncharacterized protein n=1 Tax=Centaurea solstitialis TaxID=347529 RepID=A0AA38U1G7_9ASTR|nr:hypothetical protein OSB04_002954 [Centaurea solstitialis]
MAGDWSLGKDGRQFRVEDGRPTTMVSSFDIYPYVAARNICFNFVIGTAPTQARLTAEFQEPAMRCCLGRPTLEFNHLQLGVSDLAGILTFDPNMRDRHNENHTRRLKRNVYDITSSDFDSSKQHFNQVVDGCQFGDEEIDSDYAWLLSFLTDTNEQTKSSSDTEEDENEDADDKDPQYSMFLKELTENGKSYKLKVSRNDEPLKFLEYEEQENSDNIGIGNSQDKASSSEGMRDRKTNRRVKRSLHRKKGKISTTKEISKMKEHKSSTDPSRDIPAKSCYRLLLDGCIQSEYGAFVLDGKRLNYEDKSTSSDSDILIWDNLHDCNEVNNKRPINAKKDISLKEKLMCILRQPYNQEEYEKLSEYVEKEKPVCRLLPLRHRAISSALDGVTKSVLDDVSTSFRRKLEAAHKEPPRALNLLRMFCFWLQHLPNEDIFQPWLNEECLKVLPSTTRR